MTVAKISPINNISKIRHPAQQPLALLSKKDSLDLSIKLNLSS